MPIYVFECPLCGQRNEEIFGMNDVKALKCLNCGSQMERVFTAPALTGDAQMTRSWSYYDIGMGCEVTSKADRSRKMRERGLIEAETDSRMDPYYKEVNRVHKEAVKDPHARAELQTIAREAGRVRREAAIDAELKPAFDKMVKEAPSYDGPTE